MAQAYDDEELSISLSPSQIRRNKRQGDVGYGQTPVGSINTAIMLPGNANPQLPMRDKMRTEQRIGAYNIVKTLGEGSFGKVKLAVHRSTGQQVALKIISRKKLISRDMQGRVEREIEYLQLLRHPHIIKLYTVIKTPTEIIMVLEYAGGELFDYIVQHGKMREDEARRFFQQMLCAVEYCHRHKIVHRDLKPENLLLDENLNVKIADFGLSNIMTDGNFLKTSCGSPNYAAPEVIGGKLYAGPEVDVWSCGVILYVLLVGRLPFDDEHIPSLFAKIAKGSYMVPTWMSPGASTLIKKMLVVNPVQRATIEEIRQDPWFLKDLPSYLHPPVEEFLNTGVDPNKAIRVSDIAPGAPPQEQVKLHNEVTEKISKTMGYGKRDVEEALEAEEPSAIKDAYMIVRENKLMENNLLPPDDPNASPMLDATMSSARSIASTSTGASARPYVSKVGILPSSLPAYHKVFMEREKAKAEGQDNFPDQPPIPEPGAPRSQADQEETLRRLKPHSRSFVRMEDAKRPQGLTPVNPPKKNKPVRWQFGIRSRNAPWEALVCIYKSLHKLGASWIVDEDYDLLHEEDEHQDYDGRHSRKPSSSSYTDPTKHYKLPADPWHIKIRWCTDTFQKHSAASGLSETGHSQPHHITTRGENKDHKVVATRMDVQIYEMEHGVYLVDFKVDGYETPEGKLLEDKEVTSPFPFLDMAARLIMQLADAD
ncbi:Putative carbon catabolite-derepressing protein kinase [Podospora comata]|uniref:non-specific serine/threonine protein kinase n=1 Tax=Podospora comata TaxID=48703 RepID=A0ABY6S0N9_PODCO|nr:Putative carbon catabolite-derepressing protein kinase [Podospora comata]